MDMIKTEEPNGSGVPGVQSKGTAPADIQVSESDNKNLSLSAFKGMPSSRCRRCGRVLTSKTSQQQGYGDTCMGKVRKGDLQKADLDKQTDLKQAPGHKAVPPLVRVRPTIIEELIPTASRMFISSVQALDRRVTEVSVAGVSGA